MKNITNDENTFIERLGKVVIGLRIDDWKTETIEEFIKYLKELKSTVLEFDKQTSEDNDTSSDYYKLSFISPDGNETVKTFEKTEYSNRAKLLLNSIISEIDDMGQSISEQEKRQVLMDILEKMC